ncbi:hypothetical protein HYH03_000777 [Edaphochlamys debaryana]|uniref:FAS1 domain-containing protein n=1 Tax=Edaphochlamys debaryana TaxID=47281 RepID=A0A836C6B3_9CHLO|nr:hypothetical protein HYH03_000777 [Edaphochlamys debaryana]|eukprot:KAG2500953.1 hypothetical protein HYH03_000777 [Edaphochlamys debaryana]
MTPATPASLLLLLGLVACAGLADARANWLTLLYQLVSSIAEIKAIAADPLTVATFLAPTDEAFRTFLAAAGMGEDELAGMRPADREALLKYHVVPFMALKASDLEEGADYRVPTSLPYHSIALTRAGSAVSAKGVMSSANVVARDILAGKAVIQLIDDVLLAQEVTPNTGAASGDPNVSDPVATSV